MDKEFNILGKMGSDEILVNKIIRQEREKETLYSDEEDEWLDEIAPVHAKPLSNVNADKVLTKILDKTELANQFCDIIPLYYDDACIFWVFDNKERYWKMIDDIDVMNLIRSASDANVIATKERSEIMNALKQVARSRKPQKLGPKVLQFRREIVNLETGDRFPASPKYFVTNPIPYRLGKETDTPNFDKLFSQWVKPENFQNLYEILAYCMLPDYPIERAFVLHGSGSNGKSVYRQIVRKFIGDKNCVSTDFEVLLRSRFETGKLYKKLVCEMGETNLNKLENTQIIKKIVSGKDMVGIEFKNKTPFDWINTAKLIISTNNLPPTEDKTDGFYRKWMILDFPNTFTEERDILSEIPEQEYENLALKCLYILDDLLKTRKFTNEGDFKTRRERYEERSNPFEKFFNQFIDESDFNADIPKWEFEKKFNEWLNENRLRSMSSVNINKFMREKNIKDHVIRKEWHENSQAVSRAVKVWVGVKWK